MYHFFKYYDGEWRYIFSSRDITKLPPECEYIGW